MPAQILIVDDHVAARIAIRALLNWHSFQVCGEAKDGNDAIEKTTELKPDIALLDINMPGRNGVNAAFEIRRISPHTTIVFLTVHDTPIVCRALRQWAHGLVSKSAAGIELIPMLHRLAGTSQQGNSGPARN